MRHGSLFSGIGGFDLAARWMGWENVFHVEKDDFCRKVLAKNFPESTPHEDIKEFDGRQYRGKVDIISGGFPCQPISTAGKREGTADDRYLWPEMLRIVREIQPAWVVGENVAGIFSMDNGRVYDQIQIDLEGEGYAVQPFNIPACSTGAPHRRERIWFVAHANHLLHKGELESRRISKKTGRSEGENQQPERWSQERDRIWAESGSGYKPSTYSRGISGREENKAGLGMAGHPFSGSNREENTVRCEVQYRENGRREYWSESWVEVAARICRMDDGIPRGMDRNNRIKALGNAIVPQVAFQIFQAINDH